jgi:cystathionine beta-lyase/cystathionine gamma-synthase
MRVAEVTTVETPTNPTLRVADLAATVRGIASVRSATIVCDVEIVQFLRSLL